MVFLNDRILSGDYGGQQRSLRMITGSLHFTPGVPGSTDTMAQGQLDLEGCDDAKNSISIVTVKDASIEV